MEITAAIFGPAPGFGLSFPPKTIIASVCRSARGKNGVRGVVAYEVSCMRGGFACRLDTQGWGIVGFEQRTGFDRLKMQTSTTG